MITQNNSDHLKITVFCSSDFELADYLAKQFPKAKIFRTSVIKESEWTDFAAICDNDIIVYNGGNPYPEKIVVRKQKKKNFLGILF